MSLREFGNAVSVSRFLLESDPDAVIDATHQMMFKEYSETKFMYFPSWTPFPFIGGEFKILLQPPTDLLHRDVTIAWYAAVPEEYVIEDKDLV